MTTIIGFSVYKSFHPREGEPPDLLVFANDHSPGEIESINAALSVLLPKGARVWTEGDPDNPIELHSKDFIAQSWDDPEHCQKVKAAPERAREIMAEDYALRHSRLIATLDKMQKGEALLVGRTHAIKPYKAELRDAQLVKDLHDKLESLKLYTVILRGEQWEEVSFPESQLKYPKPAESG